MDELPAGPVRVLPTVARHAVAGLAEAPLPLDIQVQQIARLGVLAAQRRGCLLQLGQAMQTELPEMARHRADGQPQVVGDLSIGLAGTGLLDEALYLEGMVGRTSRIPGMPRMNDLLRDHS
jgi:hypothetical protein